MQPDFRHGLPSLWPRGLRACRLPAGEPDDDSGGKSELVVALLISVLALSKNPAVVCPQTSAEVVGERNFDAASRLKGQLRLGCGDRWTKDCHAPRITRNTHDHLTKGGDTLHPPRVPRPAKKGVQLCSRPVV